MSVKQATREWECQIPAATNINDIYFGRQDSTCKKVLPRGDRVNIRTLAPKVAVRIRLTNNRNGTANGNIGESHAVRKRLTRNETRVHGVYFRHCPKTIGNYQIILRPIPRHYLFDDECHGLTRVVNARPMQ